MKTVDENELRDWWLAKYHNTNCEEVARLHPKEAKTGEWFKLYPVTKDQEQEWITWAKKYVKDKTRMSNALLERQWPYIYLQCSPYVNG